MKIAIVGTFLINTLFGHLCMMPMAMAAEMPTHHADAMGDIMMTPMAPMAQSLASDVPASHVDCDSCPDHEEKKEPMQKSCADHCLAKAMASNSSSIISVSSELIAALPVALPVTWNVCTDSQPLPLINGPSPPLHLTTVVMRL